MHFELHLLLLFVVTSKLFILTTGNGEDIIRKFVKNTLPECPENFRQMYDLCFILSNEASFPPKCPFPNVMPFKAYEKIILQENIAPVWMPVRRNLTNGLGFLQWMEPSSRYKTVFQNSYTYKGNIVGKDCLLYYNSSYIVATSCQEKHRRVCAYKKINLWRNPLCTNMGKCVQSTLSSASKCICVVTSQNVTSATAEFLEPYQNHVFEMLTNSTCSIGLERLSNSTYIWSNSQKVVSYSFWAPEVIFVKNYTHVGITSNGWVLTNGSVLCSLIEKQAKEVRPSLNLTLVDNRVLILNVSAPFSLQQLDANWSVYCFTDADSSSLLYRLSKLTLLTVTHSHSVYKLCPLVNNSGYYWCEGFSYTNEEAITSNVIFYNASTSFSEEFSLTYQLEYPDGLNPLSPDVFELLKKIFVNSSCMPQILRIINIDEENHQVCVEIKFYCAPKLQLYNVKVTPLTATERLTLPPTTTTTLAPVYCNSEELKNLSWPKTIAGEYAISDPYCFKQDGNPLKRLCTIEGSWSPINESCEVQNSSSITNVLLALDSNDIFLRLCEISKEYYKFNALDVYVAADRFSYGDMKDLDSIVCVVNNILRIDRNILTESQTKMRGTDNWLLTISKLTSQLVSGIVAQENFGVSQQELFESFGVAVQEIANELILLNVQYRENLDDIFKIENLVSALYHYNYEEYFTYLLYFNDAFFLDESKTVYALFGLFLLESYTFVSVVYRYDEVTIVKNIKCVYWNFDENTRGSWEPDGQFEIKNNYFVCTFWREGYYGIQISPPLDLTDALTDILASYANSSEIISRLLQQSYRYDRFTPFDVFLAGHILKKVSNNDDTNLQSLAQIATNLQKIDKSVLAESQRNANATDYVLYYLDVIIQNHQYKEDCIWQTELFATLVYSIANFSGILLFDNDTIQILVNISDPSVLPTYENLTSALLLSPDIKTQFANDSKIITNIFFNHTLFNENKKNLTYNKVSKIFDLMLPEIDENYKGPISIFHKMEPSVANFCSFWFYDPPQQMNGLWKSENKNSNFSSFIQCDFWHTTHFALLILDEDKYEDEVALEWFTNITCALSLLGFLGILLTAVLFKRWRQKTGNKILLNFVFSGIFQIVVFYISSNTTKHGILCTVTGVALHYSVLAEFLWMLTIAYLQFKRFVVVLETYPQHIILKTCLFAWGLPLIPVICVLATDPNSYANGTSGLCYPSDYGLYFAVWLPIAVIMIVNCGIFICVVRAILSKRTECIVLGGDDAIYQWRLVIFLFFMLGIAWIFGFLAEFDGGDMFVYLFCILATLQGFVMFIFFIVFNKKVRDLYRQLGPTNCSK